MALVSFSVCGGITLLSITPAGQPAPDAGSRAKLSIPWHDLQAAPGMGSLLSWHTHRRCFAGRKKELGQLRDWAFSKPQVSAKFLVAPGGAGKSHLAAEFADGLTFRGWSAGCVDLRRPAVYEGSKEGVLLVVDYPEENREAVRTLLGDLVHIGLGQRLRVLFLTRCLPAEWSAVVTEERANAVVDWTPLTLAPLTPEEAHGLYSKVLELAAEAAQSVPPPLSVDLLGEWMQMSAPNDLPLFIVALAVYSAQNPQEKLVTYSGPEVVAALNAREAGRLRKEAKDAGLAPEALILAVTYATLAGGLPADEATKDAALRLLLEIGEGKEGDAREALGRGGYLWDGRLTRMTPDIVAADFVHEALQRNQDAAPELVWRAAARAPERAVETFSRLIYDARITLQRKGPYIQDWLQKALKEDTTRCSALTVWTIRSLPLGLTECGVLVSRFLLSKTQDQAERALILNNVSTQLSDLGRKAEALKAIEDAVQIRHYLAAKQPANYLPNLAGNLTNLSMCLLSVGRKKDALNAGRKAVKIYKKLIAKHPETYLPIAMTLSNFSTCLANVDRKADALNAVEKALEIYEKLAAAQPATYLPELAMSLNNFSACLSDVGRKVDALNAAEKALGIYKKLAAAQPAAYLPDLAGGLNNFSFCLLAVGRKDEALAAIDEAIKYYRGLAGELPLAFKPKLAGSLKVRSLVLDALGRKEEAQQADAEAESLLSKA